MPEVKKEERRISPAVVIVGGALVLGLGGVALFALTARAAEELLPEDIALTDFDISPTVVGINEVVTVSVTITNISDRTGGYTLALGGDFMAQKTVTLEPGESRTVTFEVIGEAPGRYNVEVDGQFGSFDVVEVGVPAYSVLIGVSNPTPAVGEIVSWWADITNIGGAAGAPAVSWYINGRLISSATISAINPGETRRTYGSSFSPGALGVHILRVEADTAYDEITIELIGVGADIRVSNLTITPSEVMVGETVYISVTATNYGDAVGSRTITCEVT